MYRMKEFQRILVAVYFFCKCVIANTEIHPCGQEELIQCSKQIKALTATSEFNFVDNKEELDRVCPDLHQGLECIRSYTRRCMSQQEREHFSKLYFDFLKFAPCMRKVKEEYEKCAESYKNIMRKIHEQKSAEASTSIPPTTTASIVQISLMRRQQSSQSIYVSHETTTASHTRNLTNDATDQEDVQIKTVCCAFQEYMKCSESAVAKACGAETAEFTRNFLDKMLSSLIRLHCEEPEMRHCEEYSSSGPIIFSFTLVSSLSAVILLLF